MSKLFVALDLQPVATAELVRIQPKWTAGIRLVEPSQMHLTLHYLGEADAERMAAALRAVAVPAFSITFQGVGQFHSASGPVTLWAGVRDTAELLQMHTAVAAALAPEGFRAESSRYTPHVMLARCAPEVPARVVNEFLAQNAEFTLPVVPVAGFGLYSSTFVGDVPLYRCEQSFPLRIAGP